jgi:hypothetical protein
MTRKKRPRTTRRKKSKWKPASNEVLSKPGLKRFERLWEIKPKSRSML